MQKVKKDLTPHIGIYGKRNAGKSSIINAITDQNIAIVSDITGTTTDPVKKITEILTMGPVILVDTGGIDDSGELGQKRISKTLDTIKQIDAAILVISQNKMDNYEENLITEFKKLDIPFFVVHNKSDIEKINKTTIEKFKNRNIQFVEFETIKQTNKEELIELIKSTVPTNIYKRNSLIGDIIKEKDIVLLITPIDTEAPAGRMILPQVQMIRDILDNNATAIVLKESELDDFLQKTQIKPALAITDSQIFKRANASISKDIPLTSFSIILARNKGDFENYILGTPKIDELKDNDNILIMESCTHQVSCDDIGRIKIPKWLTNYTNKKLNFDFCVGLDNPPKKISEYALIVQCGACMITQKQLLNKLKEAVDASIPITNYGMAIAFMHGIYQRALEPFLKIR